MAETIRVDKSLKQINIENQISCLLIDSIENFKNINNRAFKTDLINVENLEESKVLWGKFSIKNKSITKLKLAIQSSKYSSITLLNNEGVVLGESGIYFPINQRKTGVSAISQIDFSINSKKESIYYLKLKIKNHIPFEYEKIPISLFNLNFLNKIKKSKSYFLFFFLLGISIMTISHLVQFFKLKKIHDLYFVLLNFIILMFFLVQTGQIESTIANNYFFHERLILFFGILTLLSYTLFFSEILNFHIHHPRASKFAQYLFPFLISLNFPIAMGYFIPLLFGITALLGLIIYNYVIYAAYKAVKRGDSSIRLFLIGNLIFYTGVVVSILVKNDAIAESFFVLSSIDLIQLTTLIQLFLFSLSMKKRTKQDKKQSLGF
tara:strand:+ start:118 stop:1251 length:1134 start_codon:yes stop_codon:yes gene_type:complete